LLSGKVRSFNNNLNNLFDEIYGLNKKTKILFVKRFELTIFKNDIKRTFVMLPLEQRKIFNMYFSQFLSINNSIDELIKYNIIRLYLIKSFRGKAQSLGKPSRGQRTWSNASTAFRLNKMLRMFIHDIKKTFVIKIKTESKNLKMLKKKKKVPVRFKIKQAKQKANA
jgi:ribosomal protein S13